jgi:hypothetical protein
MKGEWTMGKFPKGESDVLYLANEMKAGLTAHEDFFPDPPVTAQTLTTAITAFQTAIDQMTEAYRTAETATAAKVAALEALVAVMKKDLRYAENVTNGDDLKLKAIGWGARKEPEPTSVPGPAQMLVVYPQGEGWLELQWVAPSLGGRPTTYTVQRRLKSETAWTEIATTYERSITLQGQPRGSELEYCVLAANKVGKGPMSNTVLVVL